MKIARILLVAALFAASASLALADGTNDPTFKLGGGNTSTTIGPGGSFNFSFTQTDPPQSTFTIDYINATGQVVNFLNLFLTGSSDLSFNCDNTGDPYFTGCTSTNENGGTLISFSGTDATHHGIPYAIFTNCGNGWEWEDYDADNSGTNCKAWPPQSDFLITVDLTSNGGMPAGDSFSAQGQIGVPEPSSIVLLLSGGMLFLLYRRLNFAV